VLQVNHFFDTAARALRELEIGFRIREEAGACFLTVKGPSRSGDAAALSDRAELESALAPERARAALAGELSVVELLGELEVAGPDDSGLLEAVRGACAPEPLAEIGCFENERIRVAAALAGDDVVLEFDRTRFPAGEVRFEVELELAAGQSAQGIAAALDDLFGEAGVRAVPTTSKLARFLEILDGSCPPVG
jgi:uncharacterized protein YjbK